MRTLLKSLSLTLTAILLAAGLLSCADSGIVRMTADPSQSRRTTLDLTTALPLTQTRPPITLTTPLTTYDEPIAVPTTGNEGHPATPTVPQDWTILNAHEMWHYKLFSCPYDLGTFTHPVDTDEMAQWLSLQGEGWYNDPALLAEMKIWPGQSAPLGDRYDSPGGGPGLPAWSGDVNGLIAYRSFTLTAQQIEQIAQCDPDDIFMDIFYDNSIHVYLNGTEVYAHDNSGAPGDWNENMQPTAFQVDVRSLFCEGENHIVVTLKNCFGSRELIMAIECRR